MTLTGLKSNTKYYYEVESANNNSDLSPSVDNNGGSYYTFTTLEEAPHIPVTPLVIQFKDSETEKSFRIDNTGGGTLNWSVSEQEGWIVEVGPISGDSNTAEITVKIDSGLADGYYEGKITIMSNNADNSPQYVGVTVQKGDISYVKRVNCGGGGYTDSESKQWNGDQEYDGEWGYEGGWSGNTGDEILDTEDDEIYQSERYGMSRYRFNVPEGNYKVTLHFCEIYFNNAGERVFNVLIEGEKKLDNFDIYEEAGHDRTVIKSYTVDVKDGILDIDFENIENVAKISGIEVEGISGGQEEDTVGPEAPINLRMTDRTNSSIMLEWEEGPTASDGDIAEYYIIRSTGINEIITSNTFYTVTGLLPDTTYYFSVYAVDDAGNESESSADGVFKTLKKQDNIGSILIEYDTYTFIDGVMDIDITVKNDAGGVITDYEGTVNLRWNIEMEGLPESIIYSVEDKGKKRISIDLSNKGEPEEIRRLVEVEGYEEEYRNEEIKIYKGEEIVDVSEEKTISLTDGTGIIIPSNALDKNYRISFIKLTNPPGVGSGLMDLVSPVCYDFVIMDSNGNIQEGIVLIIRQG